MSIQIISKGCGIVFAAFALGCAWPCLAQEPALAASATPSPLPYSAQTLTELRQLQQAALKSDYAWRKRLISRINWPAADRLGAGGEGRRICRGRVESAWSRSSAGESDRAALGSWRRDRSARGISRNGAEYDPKNFLTALGASVATPATGLTADVVVVRNFDELQALGGDKVKGKIVVFNYHYDKLMASQGRGGDAYGQAVKYRSDGPSAAARLGASAAVIRSVGSAEFRLPHRVRPITQRTRPRFRPLRCG